MTRGEIWLANLNPRRGTAPGKTRPVLVVQAQALLDAGHPSTLIVPLTTNLIEDSEPLRIRVEPHGKLTRRSDLLIDQLRAIDNARLTEGPMTTLDRAALGRVDDALREVLDLAGTSAETGAVGDEVPLLFARGASRPLRDDGPHRRGNLGAHLGSPGSPGGGDVLGHTEGRARAHPDTRGR